MSRGRTRRQGPLVNGPVLVGQNTSVATMGAFNCCMARQTDCPNPDLDLPKVIDTDQLADPLQVDPPTIRRRVKGGDIPPPMEGTRRPRLWSKEVAGWNERFKGLIAKGAMKTAELYWSGPDHQGL